MKSRHDRKEAAATVQQSRSDLVSMPPEAWRMLDELRGSTSRGVWLRCGIWAVWQASHEQQQANLTPPP